MAVKMYKICKDGKIILSTYPGLYAGITTQKVFGRLTCAGGKRANRENRIFFHFWEDAIGTGFRPCKNCKPKRFCRVDCDHMPFGLTGGMSLVIDAMRPGRVKVFCELCEKFLGYGERKRNGLVYWQDGLIIPREKFEAIMA